MDALTADKYLSALLGKPLNEGGGPQDLVFADRDLVARITVAPSRHVAITDFFLMDMREFGDARSAVNRTLLLVNSAAAVYSDYSLGIDDREMLVLSGCTPLNGTTSELYAESLMRWLDLGDTVRNTVLAIGMKNYSISYSQPEQQEDVGS